ncbi:6-carboxy-5,6,7,8-tetrahydropterin synthase [Actinoalloteichus hoggarensis]|uniref:6-carboxy-5,6,7,8-tetrahydropterin synthase n=1 Tax=Actinoalloteichus hoggarensis TaxID=1470176 RepID=A0A221W6L0_9PSEU|nr:6-carboxy-5,6,7,8-tetrahydropterin synthase [Actinoalloteichus hoggarensis]
MPAGTYRISRRFRFAAAHRLSGLPDGHKCRRVHGHTWTVRVTVVARDLVDPGWVVDFAALTPLGRYLDDNVDHRDLTEVLPVSPTAEHLAAWVADWCHRHLEPGRGWWLESVVVDEGGDSTVEFRPDREPAR